MSDLEANFNRAAKNIENLKARPNDEELLEIYGLYKQATVGDCNQSKPGMFQLKEKAKHEAWLKKKGEYWLALRPSLSTREPSANFKSLTTQA